MKVTFLEPSALKGRKNVERVFGCTYSHYPFPNIFALTCAAVVREKGHDVAYLDAATAGWACDRFAEYVRGDDSSAYCIYGVNLSKRDDLAALRLIRSRRGPRPAVIFFGPGPTWAVGDYLADARCFVVRGEPDYALGELVDAIADKGMSLGSVKGIAYTSQGKVSETGERPPIEDLDALPLPARDLLDCDLYFNPKLGTTPFTAMLTSRSCPYRCIYCVPNSLSFARELEYRRFHQNEKPPVRLRSAASVIEEFRTLHGDGYRAVSIIDDQFLWNRERTKAICEGIRGLRMDWGCLARVDHIDEDVVSAMAAAGCRYVDIGIESFDQRTLDFVKKGTTVERAYRAVDIIKRAGISVKVNMLLGASPFETRASILRNMRIVRELAPSAVMFSIVSPFPGTDFHRMAVREGWLTGEQYRAVDVQKRSIVSYPNIKATELEALVRRGNWMFYLMPGFLLRNLTRVRSLRGLLRGARSLARKLSGA
ncbi:MAG: radical SAM protein [Planctomycetes bacterium]|nr:radical SAM protein [Planctomycetota bacterium]